MFWLYVGIGVAALLALTWFMGRRRRRAVSDSGVRDQMSRGHARRSQYPGSQHPPGPLGGPGL